MKSEKAVMENSETVLVIGGGLVGCEVAANVAEKLSRRVVLIQKGPNLLPRSKNAHDMVKPYLESLGVEVHVDEEVVEFDDMLRAYTTNKGNVFTAGKVYTCTGSKPNTAALKDSMSHPMVKNALDGKGYVRVDNHCRLHGVPNVFAVGDILEDRMFTCTEHAVDGRKCAEHRRSACCTPPRPSQHRRSSPASRSPCRSNQVPAQPVHSPTSREERTCRHPSHVEFGVQVSRIRFWCGRGTGLAVRMQHVCDDARVQGICRRYVRRG